MNKRGYRGLSSKDAREIRQRGHDDALEFARAIGMNADYKNDKVAKKDVIDLSGDAHSVKGGDKKWQIFLYRQNRFSTDEIFATMNGIGQLLINCINSFPETYEEYIINKEYYRDKLKPNMRALATKLSERDRFKAFLSKSMFNGGEVDYLSIKHDGKFHIFYYKDVLDVFDKHIIITNSKARCSSQKDDQKVVFKCNGTTIGEVEMRNDSKIHFREIRFNMMKPKVMLLLFSTINKTGEFSKKISLYGQANKKFGNWEK